jgi:homoserine O-acetyltransferase
LRSQQDVSVISDFKAASYIRYQGEKFVKRFDPYAYYSLLTALDTHNIGRDRINVPNALGMIKAKTLSMAFKTDVLITPDEQRYLAEHIPNGQFVEIDSIYGHDSFLIATDQMKEEIFKFLGEDR